jgi:hypothetical protein
MAVMIRHDRTGLLMTPKSIKMPRSSRVISCARSFGTSSGSGPLAPVEIRDFDAMLVPAESAGEKGEPAAKAKAITLGAKVSADLAEQFRAAASRAGTNVSALIAQFVADYVAANV